MQERDRLALEATVQGSCKMGHETRLNSDEGSLQGERLVSYVPEHSYHSEWDQEIGNLRKQVKKLEIEIRGRRQRKDREGSSSNPNYTRGSTTGLPTEVIHENRETGPMKL